VSVFTRSSLTPLPLPLLSQVHVVAKTNMANKITYGKPSIHATHRKMSKDKATYKCPPIAESRRIGVSCARDSNEGNRLWLVDTIDSVFGVATTPVEDAAGNVVDEVEEKEPLFIGFAAVKDVKKPRPQPLGDRQVYGLVDMRTSPAKLTLTNWRGQLPDGAPQIGIFRVRRVLTESGRVCLEPEQDGVDMTSFLNQIGAFREPAAVRDYDTLDDNGRPDAYSVIEEDGLPLIGRYIEAGQVILGRVREMQETNDEDQDVISYRCCSIVSDRSGVLVAIEQNVNRDYHVIIFRLHTCKVPSLGDKFCSRCVFFYPPPCSPYSLSYPPLPPSNAINSFYCILFRARKHRHGQKGTVGRLMRRWDMPYAVRTGLSIELGVNPCCIPSRMTYGHLKESSVAKLTVRKGLHVADGTPFTDTMGMEEMKTEMEAFGLDNWGDELFCCGRTGRVFKGLVFQGFVFYEVLRHLADRKVHARGPRGPVVPLTQQPTDGKRAKGGLRVGEMERDALLSHGKSFLPTLSIHVPHSTLPTPNIFLCKISSQLLHCLYFIYKNRCGGPLQRPDGAQLGPHDVVLLLPVWPTCKRAPGVGPNRDQHLQEQALPLWGRGAY